MKVKLFRVWTKNNEALSWKIMSSSAKKAKEAVRQYSFIPFCDLRAEVVKEEDCPTSEAEAAGEVKQLSIAESMELELQKLPKELRGVVEGMAYERGHSGGEEEVFCLVKSMVSDLKDAVQEYGDRRYEDGKVFQMENPL